MNIQNISFILAAIARLALRSWVVVYMINKLILVGFSHLYAGETNYPRVLFREDKNIQISYFYIELGISLLLPLLTVVFTQVGIASTLSVQILSTVEYLKYVLLFGYLYVIPFQRLEANQLNKGLFAFFYALFAFIATTLINRVF